MSTTTTTTLQELLQCEEDSFVSDEMDDTWSFILDARGSPRLPPRPEDPSEHPGLRDPPGAPAG